MEINLDNNQDYQYCVKVLAALNELEANRTARFESKRAFDDDMNKRRSLIAFLCACVLPLLVLGYYFLSEYGVIRSNNLHTDMHTLFTRTLGIVVIAAFMFIGVYVLISGMWDKGKLNALKSKTQASLLQKYEGEKEAFNQRSQEILDSEYIKNSRIPDKYLSVNMVNMLMRYFKKGHATFLQSALTMLDMDIEKSKYIQSMADVGDSLIDKEKEYLNNYKPYSVTVKL